jgi:hypothetical protein
MWGEHVTYQPRVENYHSFIELVNMHLALGEGNRSATNCIGLYSG